MRKSLTKRDAFVQSHRFGHTNTTHRAPRLNGRMSKQECARTFSSFFSLLPFLSSPFKLCSQSFKIHKIYCIDRKTLDHGHNMSARCICAPLKVISNRTHITHRNTSPLQFSACAMCAMCVCVCIQSIFT